MLPLSKFVFGASPSFSYNSIYEYDSYMSAAGASDFLTSPFLPASTSASGPLASAVIGFLSVLMVSFGAYSSSVGVSSASHLVPNVLIKIAPVGAVKIMDRTAIVSTVLP